MLRLLSKTTAFVLLALALPVTAQDAEVGKDYEITIESEKANQYDGQFGEARIGSIVVDVPNAKVAQTYRVRIIAIKPNLYTGYKQASCEFEQVDGDRKGMCLPGT